MQRQGRPLRGGSYQGFETVCSGEGASYACFKVFRVNTTGMRKGPMREGTGKR